MTVVDERQVAERLLLPEDPPRLGPISRRLLARTVALVVVLQVAGALLAFGAGTEGARAAGLSLVFPGAGFLYVGQPLLFAVTVALLVVALVLWWGLSAHLAIPLVWAGSALGAWALAGPSWDWAVPVAYVCAAAAIGYALFRFEKRYQSKRAKIPELNEYLASAEPIEREPMVREPDAMDGELLRWIYDVALQPDDGLKGLDWGEQFHGGTQLRYQLNAYCWALSLFAVNFVPNAPAQVERSLARLVEKHTDLRVWRYWRTLNLLGNFDANPDPIVRDNIMFSAFLGDVINMYEAATGSDRFDRPGSLTFVWKDGRTFEYDHHSIADAVKANYDRSRLGFFPCEPGWSFTVCNVMGAQSLLGHDTLHGSSLWSAVRDRWVRTLDEEYLTPDGTYAHIRSNHLGLSWDTGEVPNGHYFSNGSNRFADILPAHARRASALELRGAPEKMAMLAIMVSPEGRLDMELPEVPERHRTRSSALPSWTGVIAGSRMVGQYALHDAALDASARQCGTGQRWPERPLAAGSSALGGHMLIRWATPTSGAELNLRGYVPPVGPVLDSTAWDDVLVVKARSVDGASLDLVVEPWRSAVGPASFGFRQLVPAQRYVVTADGAVVGELIADTDGRASTDVAVAARVALRVEPVA
ncbi:MAG TPA: hypothetical protein VEA78_00455 [Acidimicrobiales bacterium]|nr:hypothetical protein [Acidimicrobiales bacterium]